MGKFYAFKILVAVFSVEGDVMKVVIKCVYSFILILDFRISRW
jgi:hypothetical protein